MTARQLGVQGWFWAAAPPPGMDAAAVEERLSAACAAMSLQRVGAPLAGVADGAGRCLSLLSASHAALRIDPAATCFTVFSCSPSDPAALAAAGAPVLGPGAWRWAPRGPQGAPGPGWRPTLTGWRACWAHPAPDALLEALSLAFRAEQVRAHQFAPQGRTWAGLRGPSALVLHTWPEFGLLTVDLDGDAPDLLEEAARAAGATPAAEAPDGPAR